MQALAIWATPFVLEEIRQNIPQEDLDRLKETFFSDARGYNLDSMLGKLNAVLILHGSNDEVVPAQHAREIFARVKDPKSLEILPGGDHSISDTALRGRAIALSREWFERYI